MTTSRCRVTKNETVSIETAVTRINFDYIYFDTNDEWDGVTNFRFTAKNAGYYLVNLTGSIDFVDCAGIQSFIYVNGVKCCSSPVSDLRSSINENVITSNVTMLMYLNIGEYVEAYIACITNSDNLNIDDCNTTMTIIGLDPE